MTIRKPSLAVAYLLTTLTAFSFAGVAAPPGDPAVPQSELKQIRSRIESIRKVIQDGLERRDVASADLRGAELQMQSARSRLAQIRAQRQASEQKLAGLQEQRRKTEQTIAAERTALAGELRIAYINGRTEQLALILSQAEAAKLGRMMAYYGYFGRARAAHIDEITDQLAHLDLISESIAAETEHLKTAERDSGVALQMLADARQQRQQTLASIQQTLKSRNDELDRLKRDAQALERLVEQLRLAMQDFPVLSRQPFEQVKGKLPWPVKGTVTNRFGQSRGGTLKWQGILITAQRGLQIRAPFYGRVIYSDWLPGLGLLLVIDHGHGYMSLYGHNEELYKAVGDTVQPGDAIAAVGDSGGHAQPGLYVEIRKGKEALDPQLWLQKR